MPHAAPQRCGGRSRQAERVRSSLARRARTSRVRNARISRVRRVTAINETIRAQGIGLAADAAGVGAEAEPNEPDKRSGHQELIHRQEIQEFFLLKKNSPDLLTLL